MSPLRLILRFGQFLVSAVRNHAHPLRLVREFVNFYTDLWIHAHPFYFLPECRKYVDVISLICKTNRDHVRLVLQRAAAQPSHRGTRQDRAAGILSHLIDFHDCIPWLFDQTLTILSGRGLSRYSVRSLYAFAPCL